MSVRYAAKIPPGGAQSSFIDVVGIGEGAWGSPSAARGAVNQKRGKFKHVKKEQGGGFGGRGSELQGRKNRGGDGKRGIYHHPRASHPLDLCQGCHSARNPSSTARPQSIPHKHGWPLPTLCRMLLENRPAQAMRRSPSPPHSAQCRTVPRDFCPKP